MFTYIQKEGVKKYLVSLGAQNVPHIKRGSLYDHLVRVSSLLENWGMDSDTVLAGLCHSLYSTEFLPQGLLPLHERKNLTLRLGEEAERLVYIIASIKRDSLTFKNNKYSFELRGQENSYSHYPKEDVEKICNILFANEYDHIEMHTVKTAPSRFKKFLPWRDLLCKSANELLTDLISDSSLPQKEMVRYIAHSGVQLANAATSLVIDPWLYSSSRNAPILQGLDPTSYTIDYIIPEPINTIDDIVSDVVLLSHFHTHHSPLREITELATRKPITVVCPFLDQDKLEIIRKKMDEKIFKNITFHFVKEDEKITVGAFTIHVFTHSFPDHFAFYVKLGETSILHMSDISAGHGFNTLTFAPFWNKFDNLRPDYLFIPAGGHTQRALDKFGNRNLLEVATLTPALAAKAVKRIKPKNVGIIGNYNFSVWDDRMEYGRSPGEAEQEFHWASSFLSPGTNIVTLRPGVTYGNCYPHR